MPHSCPGSDLRGHIRPNLAFGQVATDLRRAGRKASARASDTLIAATAVARGLPLYTVNPDDFRGINKLELVEIPHPDELDADSATETTDRKHPTS